MERSAVFIVPMKYRFGGSSSPRPAGRTSTEVCDRYSEEEEELTEDAGQVGSG